MRVVSRILEETLGFADISSALINTMIDAIPDERKAEDGMQQAMQSYIDGAAKWQASVAVFVASQPKEVSNG